MTIRVFVADDHELVRCALRATLDAEEDLEVVGEAGDTDSAISGVEQARPDVLLLDMRMPGGGGVVVCNEVRERCPDTRVVILTSFDDNHEVFGALSAGATGYLLKDTRPARIVEAVREVSEGKFVFHDAVAERAAEGLARDRQVLDPLSEREVEVLQLMADGLSNKQVSSTLWISETTVKSHVGNILRKLGQTDRTNAVLTGLREGLVHLKR